MKFSLDNPENVNVIRAYSETKIKINNEEHSCSLIVSAHALLPDWRPRHIDDLAENDLQQLIALKPDLVILGTGKQQMFPEIGRYHSLIAANIGVEFMNTAAACRTYNILVSEDRNVAAALILEQDA